MKFLELPNNEWINLERVDAFWFVDLDDEGYQTTFPYQIQFKVNGYEETAANFTTKEEREKFVNKIKFHFGGWL